MSNVGDLEAGQSRISHDVFTRTRLRAATVAVTEFARPQMGGRTTSSPLTPLPAGSSGPLSGPDLGTPRKSQPSSRVRALQAKAQEHGKEWTLFGQMMEDQDLLKASGSQQRVRRRTSRRTIRDTASEPAIPASERQSILDVEDSLPGSSVVQSPMQETTTLFPPDYDSSASEHDEDESNYDSDSSHTSEVPTPTEPGPQSKSRWHSLSLPVLPPIPVLYKNILKCAVAYFIASLFTFVTPLSHFIGSISSEGERTPSPSGHMVATVAVYFNPAKTAGAMLEADTYCLFGVLWSAFISLGSMAMYWSLEVKPGWEWLADVLVLIWIGLGMSAVAFMKVWMGKPSFNTACSMTTIILFVVVVKEGNVHTLLQTALIVVVGATVSNVVCYSLWPQSAATNLKQNMTRTLDSFSTLLATLTNTFLLADSSSLHQPSQGKLQRAVDNHQASFTSLKKNLAEARSEWICGGPRVPGNGLGEAEATAAGAYEDAVDSMNRLAQHLNGLRSGLRLQHDLTKAHREGRIELRRKEKSKKAQKNEYDMPSLGGRRGRQMQDSMISTNSGRGKGKRVTSTSARGDESRETVDEESATLQAAAAIFGDLADDLGPPLSALSHSCTAALSHLRDALSRTFQGTSLQRAEHEDLFHLADDIQRALFSFESTSNQAVMRMYRRSDMMSALESSGSLPPSSSAWDEDEPLTRTGVDEALFLAYFFIFTLQEFAKELTSLIDAMGRVYAIEVASARTGSNWKRSFASFFPCFGSRKKPNSRGGDRNREGLRRRFSTLIVDRGRARPANFPKVRPHAPNTVQTPAHEQLSLMGRIKQRVWRLGGVLKDRTVKFAVKAGMATALLASPAFFEATRPVFLRFRGEWALISFFVVISPTIGATNFLSLHRVLGTLLGAATAIGIFSIFPENPVALSIFGFFYSLPCFYYIVATPQYAASGRFVLLTYNLTCLYCYNIRQTDVPVFEIGYHRSVSVIIGVVYAFLVSRLWWPSEARRELGNALSDFCLDVGWLYTHLVASYSGIPVVSSSAPSRSIPDLHRIVNGSRDLDASMDGSSDGSTRRLSEESTLLPRTMNDRLNNSVWTFMAMELHLQIKLIQMQGLLAQTIHEPRLKGPFPVAMYRQILTSLQTMLDRLHSMRCVTTREEWFTNVRRDFILPVNAERREMVGNVILYFSVLSAAFKLKVPLPPYLPPAEQSRQRLVSSITRLEAVKSRDVKRSQQLLFFAYALMMKGVIQELDYLGRTLQEAFGVIGQSTIDFEALFTGNPGSSGHVLPVF